MSGGTNGEKVYVETKNIEDSIKRKRRGDMSSTTPSTGQDQSSTMIMGIWERVGRYDDKSNEVPII